MTAKRAAVFVAAGAAVTTAVLVASPGTYAFLRRLAGRGDDRHHYEELAPLAEPAALEGPDLRMSLRARLAESASSELLGTDGAANSEAARPEPLATVVEDDAVAAARARVHQKARAAQARLATERDDGDLDEPA